MLLVATLTAIMAAVSTILLVRRKVKLQEVTIKVGESQ